jgi:hypothetical protein
MVKIIDTYKATREIGNNFDEITPEEIMNKFIGIGLESQVWAKLHGYDKYICQPCIEKVSNSPFIVNYTLEIIENIPDEYIWKPPEEKNKEGNRINAWDWCNNKCKECNENDWCKMRDKND